MGVTKEMCATRTLEKHFLAEAWKTQKVQLNNVHGQAFWKLANGMA